MAVSPADSVSMVKEIQNKHMFMVPRQFSTVIFTEDSASIFFAGEMIVSLSHILFSGLGFCVIIHVSAPKPLSLISVSCPMDTRKAHTVP